MLEREWCGAHINLVLKCSQDAARCILDLETGKWSWAIQLEVTIDTSEQVFPAVSSFVDPHPTILSHILEDHFSCATLQSTRFRQLRAVVLLS